MFAQLQNTDIARAVAEKQGFLEPIRQFIIEHFGQNGLYATYILIGGAVLILALKLIRFTFDLVLLVILPSVISAFVLTFVLPYSFYYLLPATASLFTLGLILKTVAFSKGS